MRTFFFLLLNGLHEIALKAAVFRQNKYWEKRDPLPFCSWKSLKNVQSGWCVA